MGKTPASLNCDAGVLLCWARPGTEGRFMSNPTWHHAEKGFLSEQLTVSTGLTPTRCS